MPEQNERSLDTLRDVARRFDEWAEKPFNGSISMTDRYIEFAGELRSALGDALAVIERVSAEHRPLPNSCSTLFPQPLCTCEDDYPCATVRAMNGEKS